MPSAAHRKLPCALCTGWIYREALCPIFERATGLQTPNSREHREASFVCGRRSGKSSKLAANIAVYEACFRQHKLARGERGHVVCIAQTQKQARVVFRYMLSRLENSPILRATLEDVRADEIDLTNGITVCVWPCSMRSIRGLSIVCAICDEICFWREDVTGANPASEVLRAIRPAMLTFSTVKLIKISSPYAKQGPVWGDYQRRNERPDLLVWRLDSQTMNPALDPVFLAEEEERDPEAHAREYLAEFYEAASALLPTDVVDSCVVRERRQTPPQVDRSYAAALDAAFRGDAFAFAIVHRDGDQVVQDVIRSWRGSRARPVDLALTLGDIVATLRQYGVGRIQGDQFCSEPIRQAFAAQGIRFEQTATLGMRASAIWQTLRTLVTGGKIELLDDAEQTQELKRLELVITQGGNQRVEAISGHDDRVVALALAAHQCIAKPAREPWVEVLQIRSGPIEERGWVRM